MNIVTRFLSGVASSSTISKYLGDGATLIDVRTKQEFEEGSLPHALNIPLDLVLSEIPNLEERGKLILFCQSGMRSKMALQFIKSNSAVDAINAGSYDHLAHSLKYKN